MHVYYIMIKSSQKFWVVYVCYRFILEQCGYSPLKHCVIQTIIRLIHVRQGLGGIVMLFDVSKCALS